MFLFRIFVKYVVGKKWDSSNITDIQREGCNSSFQDGEYFKENKLLTEELGIALGLYIDDFELCNTLGTSKKQHKVCSIY